MGDYFDDQMIEDETTSVEPLRMSGYNIYYDERGYYVRMTPAYEGTVAPPDAVRLPEPIVMQAGFWPVLNVKKNGFDQTPNHRGETWYQEDGTPILIDYLGDPAEQGLLKEKPAVEEPEDQLVLSVTRRQARITLERNGLLEQVEALIVQYPKEIQIWYSDSPTWERYDPYVMGISLELDLSNDDLDRLFEAAAKL